MSNPNEERNISIKATIATIIPMIVIYGAFYTFGKSVIFGEVYFTTLTYSDTLIQFFLTLVWLLAAIAFCTGISLILMFIVGVFMLLKGVLYRRRALDSVQEQTKILQKTKMDLSILNKKTNKYEARLASVISTINKNEECVSTVKEWRILATDMEAVNEVIADLKYTKQFINLQSQKLNLLEQKVNEAKLVLEPSFKTSLKKVASEFNNVETIYKLPHKTTAYIFGILSITGLINCIYKYFWFDQLPIAMLFMVSITLPFWAILLFNHKFEISPVKTGPSINYIGTIIAIVCSFIFALSKGYDDARHDMKHSKIYEIVTVENIIEGRIVVSNKQYLLVYSNNIWILINRDKSKEIRLSSYK